MTKDPSMDLARMEAAAEAARHRANLVKHLVGQGLLKGRDAHFFVAGLMSPAAEAEDLEFAVEDALALMQAVSLFLPEDPSACVSEQFKDDLADAMIKYHFKKLLAALDEESEEVSDPSDAE